MKKAMLVLALMFCFVSPNVEAAITFRDGLTHDIGYAVKDYPRYVSVASNIWNEPTTVNIIDGASMNALYSYENSRVTMSGGQVGHIHVYDRSQMSISGGIVNNGIEVGGASSLDIFGGQIPDHDWLIARGAGQVHIYGGQIYTKIRVESVAIVTFHGSDFMLDGQPIGYGELFSDPDGKILTGMLVSGGVLEAQLFNTGTWASFVFIPEPATLLILGAGVLLVRKR